MLVLQFCTQASQLQCNCLRNNYKSQLRVCLYVCTELNARVAASMLVLLSSCFFFAYSLQDNPDYEQHKDNFGKVSRVGFIYCLELQLILKYKECLLAADIFEMCCTTWSLFTMLQQNQCLYLVLHFRVLKATVHGRGSHSFSRHPRKSSSLPQEKSHSLETPSSMWPGLLTSSVS